MNANTPFAVTQFTNPSGEVVFRVSGHLAGTRIRKNFRTRREADAERQSLEIQREQATSGLRRIFTRLREDNVKDAEAAIQRLADSPHTLLFCVDYTLLNYRAPKQDKPMPEAVADYVAAKTREHVRTLLSLRQLLSIKFELGHLSRRFSVENVSQLTSAKLLPYLERGKPSLKTYNNRRGLISTFFKFATQHEWITGNPVEKTPYFRINHRRGSAVTITAEKTAELMAFVENFEGGELVPYFAICLFAGIRPCVRYGEITKLRPESVKLETNVIHVEPDVSKVRMKRLVAIQPNLSRWLHAYPLNKYAIVPPNATNTRRVVFAKFGLTHDVLRHTFISMFVAKFRSMGEAALQAGNSETIIRKHYLDLKSAAEAEAFFSILPQRKIETSTASAKPIPCENRGVTISVAA
jgi:integrase